MLENYISICELVFIVIRALSIANNSVGKFLSAISLLLFFFILKFKFKNCSLYPLLCRWFILLFLFEQFTKVLSDYLVRLILSKAGSFSALLLFGFMFYKWLRFRFNYNFHLKDVFLFVQIAASVLTTHHLHWWSTFPNFCL